MLGDHCRLSCRTPHHQTLPLLPAIITLIPYLHLLLLRIATGHASPLQYRVDYRRGYLVGLGETINLTCPYTTPFYKWTPATQASWILSEDQTYSLKADSVAVSGKYVCSAVNGFGHNTAEFSIKVVDKSSFSHEQECAMLSNGHVSESGPCFLNIYSDAKLSEAKTWGDDVSLDCESVAIQDLAKTITYTWTFKAHESTGSGVPSAELTDTSRPYFSHQHQFVGVEKRDSEMSLHTGTSPSEFVSWFTGPTLRLRKVTHAHTGEYRCSVSAEPKVAGLGKLSRTFRLQINPRSKGAIIQGPHNVTATIELDRDATFDCEISEEEHRAATIRWGKFVSFDKDDANDFRTDELVRWSGGAYVVLPSIQPQNLQRFFEIPKPLAVSSPGSRLSRLVLRQASARDAGLYICSAITESGRDDYKFVQVSLKDDRKILKDFMDIEKAIPRHLTVYIAVPICVFLICICAVFSLLIRNRSRQNRQYNHRSRSKSFFISQGMVAGGGKPSLNSSHRLLDHSSLAGSASMTFTRSGSPTRQGRSTVSSCTAPKASTQAHPSTGISTADAISGQQLQTAPFSPGHIHPCAYIATDGASLTSQPFLTPPLSTYGPPPPPPPFSNGHAQKSDLLQWCPSTVDVIPPGYSQSSDFNAYTANLGFNQTVNPFRQAKEISNARVLSVSPLSGQVENNPQLRMTQWTDLESA